MSRHPKDPDEPIDPLVNDPRQLAMPFAIRPEGTFELFHHRNPEVWRKFRAAVLETTFSSAKQSIDAREILVKITGGTVLNDSIVEHYKALFISNHQELEHVFSGVESKSKA